MEYLDDGALGIYVDGSSYPGPRRGGVGVIFVTVNDDGNEVVHEDPRPGYLGATNNQMELQACVDALSTALGPRPVVPQDRYGKITIFTDSLYVADNFDRAKFQWAREGWKKRTGGPVLNAQLWKDLIKLVQRADQMGKRVELRWVKGHKNSPHNKRADKLAKASAKGPSTRRMSHTRLRRKQSSRLTEPGSVAMRGQRLTVRIISDEFLPVQRLNRYRYEVLSEKSPYYGRVDFIYSEIATSLSRGHTYHVRVNEDQQNPMIVRCLHEVGNQVRPPESYAEVTTE